MLSNSTRRRSPAQVVFRLWTQLTQAIIAKDMEAATDAKSAVEDAQRESRKKLDESGKAHVPRFFVQKDGRWVPKLQCVFLLTESPFTVNFA